MVPFPIRCHRFPHRRQQQRRHRLLLRVLQPHRVRQLRRQPQQVQVLWQHQVLRRVQVRPQFRVQVRLHLVLLAHDHYCIAEEVMPTVTLTCPLPPSTIIIELVYNKKRRTNRSCVVNFQAIYRCYLIYASRTERKFRDSFVRHKTSVSAK